MGANLRQIEKEEAKRKESKSKERNRKKSLVKVFTEGKKKSC